MASLNVTALAPSPSASALLSPPSNSSATPPLSSSNSSAPPPETPPPPPTIPAAPPQSPPPELSPPPPSSSSPPPPTPTSPPPSPSITPPPASPIVPPPTANAPPPTILSPPSPPLNDSPPPQAALSPPPPPVVVSSPPPSVVVSSPPPLASAPPPPVPVLAPPPSVSLSPPPPAAAHPPQSPPSTSPPPPVIKKSPPPPITSSKSPPPSPSNNPPPSSVQSPPPPPAAIPSSSPPIVPPPSASQTNSSVNASSIPTEKPTARSATPSTDTTANNTTSGGGSLKAGPVAAIGIVVGFLALSLVIFAVWFVQKRKKKTGSSNNGYVMPSPSSQNSDSHFLQHQKSARSAYNSSLFPVNVGGGGSNFAYSPENGGGGGGGIANSRSWFTYEELATATDGFSSNNLLGEGGFGCVYKGILSDGRIVAVKQLKAGGGQGEREFRAEVEIISRVHHRHLVSLVGYCIYEHQRILVYDYVPNDTLHHHLHGESRVMDWAARIKFAAGAARGIAYLHEDCNPRIIHRDIKSANILLDENFEAKVADFGLAKLMELSEQTHVSTRVMGTFGYMAPEYATSGKLTEKSDVYSFGVVLLELITGRKPVDTSQPFGDESLVEWARPLMSEALESGNFGELIDTRLENFVESEMLRLIETAAACVRHSASKRPRMSQVVRALDMIDETGDITNGMKPGQSQVYDSREQSAQIRMFNRMAFGGSQGFTTDSFDNSQTSWRS